MSLQFAKLIFFRFASLWFDLICSWVKLIILRELCYCSAPTFFAIDVLVHTCLCHLPPFASIDDLNPLVVCTNNAPIITKVVKAFESSWRFVNVAVAAAGVVDVVAAVALVVFLVAVLIAVVIVVAVVAGVAAMERDAGITHLNMFACLRSLLGHNSLYGGRRLLVYKLCGSGSAKLML